MLVELFVATFIVVMILVAMFSFICSNETWVTSFIPSSFLGTIGKVAISTVLAPTKIVIGVILFIEVIILIISVGMNPTC